MKKTGRACLILLTAFSLFFSGACGKSERTALDSEGNRKQIALIMNMDSGYHWGSLKMGADMAAREFNVNVESLAPSREEDAAAQIRLVEQAIEKKVNAIILAASDYHALAPVTEKAYERRIPVIVIDSEVNTKKINGFIATDNLDAGKKAGSTLLDIAGQESTVAIISPGRGAKNAEQREEGVMSVISRYPGIRVAAKEYCSSDSTLAAQLARKILQENAHIDAVVALNSAASEGVAEAVEKMGLAGKVKVIGFDNTPKEIDYLEKGVIQGIIIQNPHSMGYLGVKHAVDAINGKVIPKYVDTGSRIINPENMYLPENQKLLFPFVK